METKTEHFTLAELCKSETASKQGIDNTPPDWAESNLKKLMVCVLEPARLMLGVPIIVTSGYRSERLNKVVGGVSNSQHMKGEAVDLVCTKYEDKRRLFEVLLQMNVDQLLWERNSKGTTWVHVSFVDYVHNRNYKRDNYNVK